MKVVGGKVHWMVKLAGFLTTIPKKLSLVRADKFLNLCNLHEGKLIKVWLKEDVLFGRIKHWEKNFGDKCCPVAMYLLGWNSVMPG